MSRLMSVSMTEQAVVDRIKTVTRRKGWWLDKNGRHLVKVGDRLTLVRKSMGRKPGEELVRLAEVEVVSVRRERLSELSSMARRLDDDLFVTARVCEVVIGLGWRPGGAS